MSVGVRIGNDLADFDIFRCFSINNCQTDKWKLIQEKFFLLIKIVCVLKLYGWIVANFFTLQNTFPLSDCLMFPGIILRDEFGFYATPWLQLQVAGVC